MAHKKYALTNFIFVVAVPRPPTPRRPNPNLGATFMTHEVNYKIMHLLDQAINRYGRIGGRCLITRSIRDSRVAYAGVRSGPGERQVRVSRNLG